MKMLFIALTAVFVLNGMAEEWRNYSHLDFVYALAGKGDVLWAGTNVGLLQYNKKTGAAAQFNKTNASLPENAVTAVAVDSAGTLWAGFSGRGLGRFNGATWTFYDSASSPLPSNSVTALQFDKTGLLWVGTARGPATLEPGAGVWNLFAASPGAGKFIASMALDSSGAVWTIVTQQGPKPSSILLRYDGLQWRIFTAASSQESPEFYCLCADTAGTLWAGGPQGLFHFGPAGAADFGYYREVDSNFQRLAIYSLAKDNGGRMWAGMGSGLWEFSPQESLFLPSAYPSGHFGALLADTGGILWAGLASPTGGLARIEGGKFTTLDISDSKLPQNKINWLGALPGGRIWAGTSLGAVAFDPGVPQVETFLTLPQPFAAFSSFAVSPQGNIWAADSRHGIEKYDGSGWSPFDTANSGLPSDRVSLYSIDDSDNIWMGLDDMSAKGGLVRFDGTSGWTTYDTSNSSIPTRYIQCVHRDRNGNLWVGTDGGLSRYDGKDWSLFDTKNSPLPYTVVRSLASDGKGNLWVGTGHPFYESFPFAGGTARFDDSTWKIFDTANSGLPSNLINAIAAEENGTTWFGTDKGLARYDGNVWKVFNAANSGLSDNYILSVAVDSLGNTWAGTRTGGLYVYNENKITISVESVARPAANGSALALRSSPNPFRGTTDIHYRLPAAGRVSLKIFDAGGRLLRVLDHAERSAGLHRVRFDGRALPNGVYLCRLEASGAVISRKVLLAR